MIDDQVRRGQRIDLIRVTVELASAGSSAIRRSSRAASSRRTSASVAGDAGSGPTRRSTPTTPGTSVERRTLNSSAAIHGAIDASARNAPGYWEPPIPATVDVGIGYAKPQLPRTTMGRARPSASR